MRLPGPIDDLRALSTGALVRRGWIVAALVLAERLVVPAAVLAIFGLAVAGKVASFLVLGAAVTARGVTQRAWTARTEADLVDTMAGSVLHGDVLRPNLLETEDARMAIVQAIYHAGQTFIVTLPNLAADLVACAALCGLLLFREPPHVVAMAAALAVAAGGALLFSRRSLELAAERAWEIQGRVYEALGNAIDGRLEVVASGARAAFLGELRSRTRLWGSAGTRVAVATLLSGRLPMLGIAGLVAAVVLLNYRAFGTVSLGDAALVASASPAFVGVAQQIHALARAQRWVQMLARIQRGRQEDPKGTRPATSLPTSITFQRVSFRYEGASSPALVDANFAWDGRGALALAGPNGSGKSTCLRLLLALAAPGSGAILIGGQPLAELDADRWRAQVAFLPQRPYMPSRATVAEAVRWLVPLASDDRILRELDRVGMRATLERSGGGALGVAVSTLSVGERQRVALARMLCSDASLFLFDEPDANLDRAGIFVVAGVLRELSREHMVVFAAHTPDLLAAADHTVVLDAGRVVGRDSASPA